jgi:hypothetical protein
VGSRKSEPTNPGDILEHVAVALPLEKESGGHAEHRVLPLTPPVDVPGAHARHVGVAVPSVPAATSNSSKSKSLTSRYPARQLQELAPSVLADPGGHTVHFTAPDSDAK